ncbi:hypothetical protein H8356DRAFT_1354320 [Neocallimastix lanati (nom. inval.)]|nr:hypothetical protein H8356DRAFT_1354320 [Neocallimastix sp. JGI-2020a]
MNSTQAFLNNNNTYKVPIFQRLIQSGKAIVLGRSAMLYQLYKSRECARQHGWVTFVSTKNHYNLVYRKEKFIVI